MPNSYVDRGIIKWAPFDALVGYQSMIKELKMRLAKRDRPLLSSDQYEELNQKLHVAWQQNLEISIVYYQEGYLKSTIGYLKKIDPIQQLIILTHFEKIRACDVMEINF